MANFQIETVQNVKINQNIASLGKRIGATLIDYMIFYFYFIIISLIVVTASRNSLDNIMVLYIILSLPVIFYHLILEYYLNGQTLGKKALKIQVVKLDGARPDFIAYLLRWAFRLIDVNLLFGVVGIITYLVNGKGQRLGDILAGTTVIDLEDVYRSKNTFIKIDDDYQATFPQVTIFSDEDMTKIKNLYIKGRRSNDMNLLKKLRDKIVEKTGIESDLDDIEFVKTIVKDYYFYYYYQVDEEKI